MRKYRLKTICVNLTFIAFVFMMCPKPSRLTALEESKGGPISPQKQKMIMSGDIINTWSSIEIAEPGFEFSDAEMEKFKLWPRGIIPYFIDDVSFDKSLCTKIRMVLDAVNSITGLKFLELYKPPEQDSDRWVFFINRRAVLPCEDYATNSFTNFGVQMVYVHMHKACSAHMGWYDCFIKTQFLGSMILALVGVPPQHNAPNRDEYINIVMDNIMPNKKKLFQVLHNEDWLFHDVDYDFLSAGHYNFHKYTINGSATIMPKVPIVFPIGEGAGLTYSDIWKIRMLYNYISRKRILATASDCSKMFKPGNEFDAFVPVIEDKVQPRKKPNKYLGFAEYHKSLEKEASNEKISEKGTEKPKNKLIEVLSDNGKEQISENFSSREQDKDNDVKSSSTNILMKKKRKENKLKSMTDWDTSLE